MTIKKTIIYSIFIPQAIGQLIIFICFHGKIPDHSNSYALSLLLLSILGLIFGVILSVLVRKPGKEPWFYVSGQILAFGLLLGFILKENTGLVNRENKFKNASDRYLYIYQDNLPFDQKIEKIAIEKLESKFDKPNAFLLSQIYTRHIDTIVSGNKTINHIVYFTYDILERDSLFSKISVLNDTAYIVKFNADATKDNELELLKY